MDNIYDYITNNRQNIERSQIVGCCSCAIILNANEIEEYIDNGCTGICPDCYVDAILPESDDYILTVELLQALKGKYHTPAEMNM